MADKQIKVKEISGYPGVNRGRQLEMIDEYGVPIPEGYMDLNGCAIVVGPQSLTIENADGSDY